jgi:glutamate racemase
MIGVFDSGFGGLTIHRALIEALPEHDFVYLGDNRNAPYGSKSPIDVLNLTCAGLERLFDLGCTLVILACNTASVVALRWIQQQWLPVRIRKDGVNRNVLGIVVPTIEAATGLGWDQEAPVSQVQISRSTIVVFATPRTVESNCYPLEVRKRRPEINVVQQACPELAGAIEKGGTSNDLRALVEQYVTDMRLKTNHPDCAILACTHFPLVADYFAAALHPSIPIVYQPRATAHALQTYLRRHPEYHFAKTRTRAFLSTGFSAAALPAIERFWGERLVFQAA